MVQFKFASTEVKVEKEVYAYPVISFIGELGGSLGLFIGFSFLTILDCFDFLVDKTYRLVNK